MNITQDDLTAKTGLTRKQIICIEKGTSDYRIETFLRYLEGIDGPVLTLDPGRGILEIREH